VTFSGEPRPAAVPLACLQAPTDTKGKSLRQTSPGCLPLVRRCIVGVFLAQAIALGYAAFAYYSTPNVPIVPRHPDGGDLLGSATEQAERVGAKAKTD